MQTEQKTNDTCLGMRREDLTLRDICEELTDLKRHLSAIMLLESNKITQLEFTQLVLCGRELKKEIITEAIKTLTEWKIEASI